MAIAFDTSNSGNGATADWSYSHTCTGTNLLLFAFVSANTSNTPTVTYGGVSMTQIGTTAYNVGGYYGSIFYLIAPLTGSNTVATNATGNTDSTTRTSSYTGMRQYSQPDASIQINPGANTTITTTVSVVASNCWLVGGYGQTSGTTTPTAPAVVRQGSNVFLGDSNSDVGLGNQSMTFSWVSSTVNYGYMASFAPSIPTIPKNLGFKINNLRPRIFSPGLAR